MPEHMNPDFPNVRGCWVDTRVEGKFVVNDYPTWREKTEPQNLPPYHSRNTAIRDGKPWQKEFVSAAEVETFMREENYVRCDMPASLRPKREVKAVRRETSEWDF